MAAPSPSTMTLTIATGPERESADAVTAAVTDAATEMLTETKT